MMDLSTGSIQLNADLMGDIQYRPLPWSVAFPGQTILSLSPLSSLADWAESPAVSLISLYHPH